MQNAAQSMSMRPEVEIFGTVAITNDFSRLQKQNMPKLKLILSIVVRVVTSVLKLFIKVIFKFPSLLVVISAQMVTVLINTAPLEQHLILLSVCVMHQKMYLVVMAVEQLILHRRLTAILMVSSAFFSLLVNVTTY